MNLTKHAHARFKQRQKVKNEAEMIRKFALAMERGTLLANESSRPRTLCILFNGYKYIVSQDKKTLITMFPAKKSSESTKHYLIDRLLTRQYAEEVKLGYTTI